MRQNIRENKEKDHLMIGEELLWSFCCPSCRGSLTSPSPGVLFCPHEGIEFLKKRDIWRLLIPERINYFEKFIQDYETIRLAEGRGSNDPAYYRSLPYHDLTRRWSGDWHIRAKSYEALEQHVLGSMVGDEKRPLKVLDLGAGNGWLSNRLASAGHIVCAVDLMINEFDGLGACRFYETKITPLQAEFDRLPLSSLQADLIIFNSSLHYSPDYLITLREALRVLRQNGNLVIVDTPIYKNNASGNLMVAEREDAFQRRFGIQANSIPSRNFMTFDQLDSLSMELNLHWRLIYPNYGLRWRLKPWLALLRGQREPAHFILTVGSLKL